jgi:hypothetical protein
MTNPPFKLYCMTRIKPERTPVKSMEKGTFAAAYVLTRRERLCTIELGYYMPSVWWLIFDAGRVCPSLAGAQRHRGRHHSWFLDTLGR